MIESRNGYLNRYDIIVRYLAIENYFGKNDFGFRLYSKMQDLRIKAGYSVEACERFRDLISSFEKDGYQRNSYILMDKNLTLIDGAHRLALALYYKLDNIGVEIAEIEREFIKSFSLDWFFENGFTHEEIAVIEAKAQEIISGISSRAFSVEYNPYYKIRETESESDKKLCFLRNYIVSSFYGTKSSFGRGGFYQSFPRLGIDGQRPTETRIDIYKLNDILSDNMNVLDIGCNIGFLDMSIADRVKSILGIEYESNLVNIANKTSEMLEIQNVKFISADFNKWHSENTCKFDLVLSFAVHYWLNVNSEEYAEMLNNILNNGGYCVIESQDINTVDSEFESKYMNTFCKVFTKCYEGYICDDGKINRKWAVFRKK